MSLRINVAQLLKESLGSTETHKFDERFPPLGESGANRATGTVRLVRTDNGIWVSGEANTTAGSTCSRCLTSFDHQVHVAIDDLYLTGADNVISSVLEGADGDGAEEGEQFTIDHQHTLDLAEAIRQYSIAAAPMQLLCRPDCQGLCPQCGVELNKEQCQCGQRFDAAWAPLLEKLNQQSDSD